MRTYVGKGHLNESLEEEKREWQEGGQGGGK